MGPAQIYSLARSVESGLTTEEETERVDGGTLPPLPDATVDGATTATAFVLFLCSSFPLSSLQSESHSTRGSVCAEDVYACRVRQLLFHQLYFFPEATTTTIFCGVASLHSEKRTRDGRGRKRWSHHEELITVEKSRLRRHRLIRSSSRSRKRFSRPNRFQGK